MKSVIVRFASNASYRTGLEPRVDRLTSLGRLSPASYSRLPSGLGCLPFPAHA